REERHLRARRDVDRFVLLGQRDLEAAELAAGREDELTDDAREIGPLAHDEDTCVLHAFLGAERDVPLLLGVRPGATAHRVDIPVGRRDRVADAPPDSPDVRPARLAAEAVRLTGRLLLRAAPLDRVAEGQLVEALVAAVRERRLDEERAVARSK